MEERHTTPVPPFTQAATPEEFVGDGVHISPNEGRDETMLDLPVVHTGVCCSGAYLPSSGIEQDNGESPVPGMAGLSISLCQDIPSPPYSASFSGLLSSMPSTSQTASSPLLDTTCSHYQQQFIAGATTDLSTSDDQLSGTCMHASGTLSGFQGTGVYSPLPMFGESSALSCSALKLPAYDSKSNLSETASALLAICRICHQPGDEYDILISPCRCAGTLQFIHNTCLMVSITSTCTHLTQHMVTWMG